MSSGKLFDQQSFAILLIVHGAIISIRDRDYGPEFKKSVGKCDTLLGYIGKAWPTIDNTGVQEWAIQRLYEWTKLQDATNEDWKIVALMSIAIETATVLYERLLHKQRKARRKPKEFILHTRRIAMLDTVFGPMNEVLNEVAILNPHEAAVLFDYTRENIHKLEKILEL